MKHLFRHLILLLLAWMFFDGTIKSEMVATEDFVVDWPVEMSVSTSCVDAPDSEWCLPPRRISSVNNLRVQTMAKRTNYVQRYSGGFFRISKNLDVDYYPFISNKSLILHSFFVEPVHRLISLGKLII